MRRMLLVAAVLGFTGVASADDKIIVKDNNGTTIIINGPVIVSGNNNIVQIGNGNKVIINSPTKKTTPTSKTSSPAKMMGNKACDYEAARHNNQVAAWMAMMGKR